MNFTRIFNLVIISSRSVISLSPFRGVSTSRLTRNSTHNDTTNLGTIQSKQLVDSQRTLKCTKEDTMQELSSEDDDDCQHYIFGYGSLICPQSRAISAPTLAGKDAHPVLVQHLARTWSARVYHKEHTRVAISINNTTTTGTEVKDFEGECHSLIEGQTAMGVRQAINHTCSGVLIEVDKVELMQFDEREKGYDRIEIDLLHIWSLEDPNEKMEEEGEGSSHSVIEQANLKRSLEINEEKLESHPPMKQKVWVYIQRDSIPADHRYPIAQSYVDIILRGCLTISPHFAAKFVETTHGWWSSDIDGNEDLDDIRHIWVEDRNNPFYVRADKEWSKDKAHVVDRYLRQHQSHAFEKRRQVELVV